MKKTISFIRFRDWTVLPAAGLVISNISGNSKIAFTLFWMVRLFAKLEGDNFCKHCRRLVVPEKVYSLKKTRKSSVKTGPQTHFERIHYSVLVWLWHFVVDGKMSSFLLSNYFQSNRFSSQRARPSLWKMKRKIWKPVIRKLKVKTRMQNLGKHVILSSSPRSTQMCCCIYYSYEFTQLIKTCDLCLIKKPAGILKAIHYNQ